MKNFSIIFIAKLGSRAFVGIHQSCSQKRESDLFFSHKSVKNEKIRVSVRLMLVIVIQHLFCQTLTDSLENNL